ncbi:hypothetical protein COM13_29285 [Bacillus pseudomycoides]|nr:hypothetical protein COO07_23280 [Bacillus pseudomycoides]PEK77991.1 hypothetical protein CN597_17735 [Bacillus pseudomycoides]PEN03361.1 hypothetical protein CN640_26580 [Bacillus pseudomycoides]PGB76225.1 hypothetical protein COM13_29285 [Bacillus pseudomycoides]PGS05128.1 hypothetical protein COC54_11450 [Bacillus pseudomycoides]
MSRKVYDRQFKMAAVQLVLEENMFVKEVAKELLIHSQYEMKKLKHENEELRKELDLSKKFQVFLKKKNV